MQVAKLYLRGNLVNYTGKNLNKDQRLDRDRIFFKIDNDPQILPSKSKFQQKLAETIGGEYCNPKAAEVEWWTATWRAILSVTYHIPLEYRTFAPAKINGKKARQKGIIYDGNIIEIGDNVSIYISEQLPIPPQHTVWVCSNKGTKIYKTNGRGLLTNPSEDTRYVIIRDDKLILGPIAPGKNSHRTKFNGIFGTFLRPIISSGDILKIVEGPDAGREVAIERATMSSLYFNTPRPLIIGSDPDMMQRAYTEVMGDRNAGGQGKPQFFCHPDLRPVHVVLRSRRATPEVIFDEGQMRKLVKNFGWEFIGQILKENKRDMIKTQIHIEDNAERVALKLLESLFSNSKEGIRFEVCNKTSTVKTETGLLPISMVMKIAELKREFDAYNVGIKVDKNKGVEVTINKEVGGQGRGHPCETPIIRKKITEIRFNQTKSFDDKIDDENTIRNNLEAQIANKEKLVSHFESMQARDAMRELLTKLPDNAATFISLMMSPPPDLFEKFGGSPRERDIAAYMGVNPSQIKKYKETIRLQMLALGMGPEDSLESQI